MLNHNGWSAWISVDGQELPQYQITVKEEISGLPIVRTTYKVSCWIASEEGKEFTIHAQANPGIVSAQNSFRVSVSLDGSYAQGRFMNNPSLLKTSIGGSYCQISQTETPFLFSKLTLTDDDSALRDISHLKDLGIISINVERVVLLGPSAISQRVQKQSVAEKGPIHEASKKAGAHCVSFGKPKPTLLMPSSVDVRSLGGPLITFEFRYRSMDMLRAQEIIPPVVNPKPIKGAVSGLPNHRLPEATAAAGPSSSKRKVKREAENEGVDAEIKALKERLNALERKRNKENRSESSTRPKKKAKVEPLDHTNFNDDEVIDLT